MMTLDDLVSSSAESAVYYYHPLRSPHHIFRAVLGGFLFVQKRYPASLALPLDGDDACKCGQFSQSKCLPDV